MFTRIALVLCAFTAAAAFAQNPPIVKKVPVSRTSPASGPEMFANYCASCHGKEGRGDGPVVAALKKAPPDLTIISARNNGAFPELQVLHAISGEAGIPAHGSLDMPVWGEVFRSLNSGSSDLIRMRLSNLTDYVKSLQK
jgi:mono/diheme cytochrome c family protein